MNLTALSEYIASAAPTIPDLGAVFVHEFPSSATHGALLMYMPVPIDGYLPKLRKSSFRIVTRSDKFTRAQALARALSNLLHISGNVPMGQGDDAVVVRVMRPVTEPLPYRRSTAGYLEVEVEFEVTYEVP